MYSCRAISSKNLLSQIFELKKGLGPMKIDFAVLVVHTEREM